MNKIQELIKKAEDKVNSTMLSNIRKTEINLILLEIQKEAINYTHCFTELKAKEAITFEEWLFVNNYKKLFDYFVKDAVSFTESELMQIYNDQVMRL